MQALSNAVEEAPAATARAPTPAATSHAPAPTTAASTSGRTAGLHHHSSSSGTVPTSAAWWTVPAGAGARLAMTSTAKEDMRGGNGLAGGGRAKALFRSRPASSSSSSMAAAGVSKAMRQLLRDSCASPLFLGGMRRPYNPCNHSVNVGSCIGQHFTVKPAVTTTLGRIRQHTSEPELATLRTLPRPYDPFTQPQLLSVGTTNWTKIGHGQDASREAGRVSEVRREPSGSRPVSAPPAVEADAAACSRPGSAPMPPRSVHGGSRPSTAASASASVLRPAGEGGGRPGSSASHRSVGSQRSTRTTASVAAARAAAGTTGALPAPLQLLLSATPGGGGIGSSSRPVTAADLAAAQQQQLRPVGGGTSASGFLGRLLLDLDLGRCTVPGTAGARLVGGEWKYAAPPTPTASA